MAGDVDRIEARQLYLHRDAGGSLRSLSVLDDNGSPGVAVGNLAAAEFQSIELQVRQANLQLVSSQRPTGAAAASNRTRMSTSQGQVSLDVSLQHPVGVTVVSFRAEGDQILEPLRSNRWREVELVENRAGIVVGSLADTSLNSSDENVHVSDDRFEVVAGELRLRDGVHLRRHEAETVRLDVAADLGADGELFESFLLTVSKSTLPWRNPERPLDVNRDGLLTPFDVLLIVNFLNSVGSGLLVPPPDGSVPVACVDANGDDFASPLDALLVVNATNAAARQGSGEGELFLVDLPEAASIQRSAAAPRIARIELMSQFAQLDFSRVSDHGWLTDVELATVERVFAALADDDSLLTIPLSQSVKDVRPPLVGGRSLPMV